MPLAERFADFLPELVDRSEILAARWPSTNRGLPSGKTWAQINCENRQTECQPGCHRRRKTWRKKGQVVDIRSPISPARHAKGYSPPTGLRARYSPADAGQCSLKQLHPQGLPVPRSLTDTAPQSLNDHLRLPCAECDGHGS